MLQHFLLHNILPPPQIEAYPLLEVHILLLLSPAVSSGGCCSPRMSPDRKMHWSLNWSHSTPWCHLFTIYKLHQSLCHLLPCSNFHKHWWCRHGTQTLSFLTMPKSWHKSGIFKLLCGWSSNTLAFSSLAFLRLKAELVIIWKFPLALSLHLLFKGLPRPRFLSS